MTKFVKLIPLLIALAFLAGVPVGVSGQETVTVGFSSTEYTVTEGDGTVSITMVASPAPTHAVSVRVSTADRTAVSPRDYRAHTTIETFAVDDTTKTINLLIVNDLTVEDSESFFVRLEQTRSGQTGVTISESNGEATVTIEDDDTATVGWQRTTYTVSENSGRVQVCATVISPRVTCPIAFPFTVQLSAIDGTAVSPEDYQLTLDSLEFGACGRTYCVNIAIVDDGTIEDLEAFTVELVRPPTLLAGITLTPDTATVEIADIDRATVRLDPQNYRVNESDGSVSIGIELVNRSATCPSDVPVILGLEASDATGELSLDYGPVDTTVTFESCQRTQTVVIPIIDDGRVEHLETFAVRLVYTESTDRRIRVDSSRAVVEIADTADDTAVVGFDSAEYSANEGESLELGVGLSGDATCPVEFRFDVLLGSAIPRGARSAIPKPASLIRFDSCDSESDITIDTGDIEATAELRFELGRTSSLDPRISFGQSTAAAYIVDTGGTTEVFDSLVGAGNGASEGIWSDGTTMWVSDLSLDKIFAYNMDTKQRDSDKDFDTLSAAMNNVPDGLWSDGITMWVADPTDDKLYAYNLDTKERYSAKDFDTLIAAGNNYPEGMWSDGATMWVANAVNAKIFAYNLETKQRDSTKDFDTLSDAGNGFPASIWSDGTTMWVSDFDDAKIYAYDLETKQRAADKDFNALGAAGNERPMGIWSDGTIMWVLDQVDDEIYAYYFPVEPVLSASVRRVTTTTTTDSTETDPARSTTIKTDLCVADIVDPDGGEIELGNTIEDSWDAGCPSITRGGRLAKYYTFDLPITTTAEIALDSHLDDYLVLRSGGLSGDIVEQDDDDGPGNNSLIEGTLTAGKYTIEATTFYADGVEADFTLSVRAVPRILYDGPVADVAHTDYSPDGPTLTVKLLPTLPMGTLEITVEDADGFGEGTGPLGGARADDGSAGTVMLALPKSAWVEYGGIHVEARKSGAWSPHTQADEQAMLTRHSPRSDLSPVLLGLIQLIGKTEGALELLQSLAGLTSSAFTPRVADQDESVLDAIFRKSHANCVSQVTVPWLVQETETTGVRVSVPLSLEDEDYLSLAASFVANGEQPALAQLHDLLATGQDAPFCVIGRGK